MKKLKVDLNSLKVDSFEVTSKLFEKEGTVVGNANTNYAPTCEGPTCDELTCLNRVTCVVRDTCGVGTCPGTAW